MNNLIPLKKIIEDLKGEDKIPIGYQSFRQAYLGNKLNEDVVKYIVKIKKFTSTSYYINNTDVDKFSEALLNQFNN